jgi:hypothetical protein
MPIKTKKTPNRYLYIFIGILFIALISTFLYFHFKKPQITIEEVEVCDCDHVNHANAPIVPSKKLNDLNDLHLLHAQTNGLKKPFQTNEEYDTNIDELIEKKILVEVKENQYYKLKSLTHSHPYLIPESISMLNEIGIRFQEKLKEKKYKNYCFRLTSLLRTEETQQKLSKRNHNATGHSAHLYGTTVDISYKNFYNPVTDSIESSYEGVQTLTKVLTEMREECKIIAIRERKQSCFHITVVSCKPVQNN